MAETTNLNGAYYGPSIPPPSRPSKSYHRPGRGGGCGLCGCRCLFSLIFKIIITVVVIVGLAALIIWLVFRPNKIKYHVTEATLTKFNLTSDNILHYDLALNITVRNPNKRIGVYYDRIEARAYLEDERFNTKLLPKFYQGHKNTTVLSPVFSGQNAVVLSGEEKTEYEQQKKAGVYDIDVKLYLRIRFKFGKVKTWRLKPKIKCDLKVPISADGKSPAVGFKRTKCDIDF
ncbi:LOW QUALITY PROTEIN: NDR1/HIN1-like protein 3 [Morus notabilis]|uniref:LOW QUALITY PROTEIN: NDR1/HIN1-like protein 3 n=1 Tax=Morus notabilis TaxID=981085 RepID=UPI000CED4EED|nr:LOW QUALITY PROTEIN: NDR1/HIN1-like protein 3 [Morus notabilis]